MSGEARPVAEARGLEVTLPTGAGPLHAVRGVDLEVAAGETLAIVGESGCGKSMTALALLGLLPPDAERRAERLCIGDVDMLPLTDRKAARHVRGQAAAMIFQEPMTSLNPVYTIGRQLTETMTLRGTSMRAARERAIDLLDAVGLPSAASRLDQYPHQFSGGQRQRIMIAMALMNAPALLIADEPTTALDVTIQAQILRLLQDLQRDLGLGLLLITHDLGVVSRVADRVAVMYAGAFVEQGPVADVLRAPVHPYTQGLLASLPDAAAQATRLGVIPGVVPALTRPVAGCAFSARCPVAQPDCTQAPPPERTVRDRHRYRCIHAPAEARGATAPPALGAGRTSGARSGRSRGAAIIDARGLARTYRVRRGLFARAHQLAAVDDVTLTVERGETLAIVGESGSGKSTLARLLLGLEPADSGSVTLDGRPVDAMSRLERARLIQPVFQDPYSSLNPRATIGAIVRRPLEIHGLGDAATREASVRETLARVGLPPRLFHAYPNQLSGGQRQRAAIARALVLEPRLLLCDEATSALDVSVQAQILNLLVDLRDTLGLTLLLITHNLAVVRHMADRVAVMYLGRLVEVQAAGRLFAAPDHPYTAALLASMPSVAPGAGVPDAQLGGAVADPLAVPKGCAFHPRCPMAMARCREHVPPETRRGMGRVACHLHVEQQVPVPA